VTTCQIEERDAGRSYSRTCPTCGLSGACLKGLDRKGLLAYIAALEAQIAAAGPTSGYIAGLKAAHDRCDMEIKNCRANEAFSGDQWELYFDGLQDAKIVIQKLADKIPTTDLGSTAAMVGAAYEAAAESLLETSVWCDSQERTDDGWRNGLTDARKRVMARIRALTPADAAAALQAYRNVVFTHGKDGA